VAQKVATALNEIYTNEYIAGVRSNEEAATCLACHGTEGKVNNSSVKMGCTSCHTESVGHKVFADIHYKLMK
jgi:anti-sigma regulatory factor (Ser/Thr protein kinase)